MLEAFGLALPLDDPYSDIESARYDIDALSAISLPLRFTGSSSTPTPFPSISIPPSSADAIQHSTTVYTKQSLTLPQDADHRIKSFLSFFRLEPSNPKSKTIYRPYNRDPAGNEEKTKVKRKTTHKSECCTSFTVEPHWQMWTILHCDF